MVRLLGRRPVGAAVAEQGRQAQHRGAEPNRTGASTSAQGTSTQPNYGSIMADGYDWLVKYGQQTSPLYAIGKRGRVHEVADKNGYLYVAGGQFSSKSANNNRTLKVDPNNGKTVKTYKRGLTDVRALAAGPGDNIWFLDKKSAISGKVGELNVRSGKISEYALPAGVPVRAADRAGRARTERLG